jgi:hypothetical protein
MVSPWTLVPARLPPPTKSSNAGNEALSQALLVFLHFIRSSWKWFTSAESLAKWRVFQISGQGSPDWLSLTVAVFPEGSEAHVTYQKLPTRGNVPRSSGISRQNAISITPLDGVVATIERGGRLGNYRRH